MDIIVELQKLSVQSCNSIETVFKKQDAIAANLLVYVKSAKEQIKEILALEDIQDISEIESPRQVRKVSRIHPQNAEQKSYKTRSKGSRKPSAEVHESAKPVKSLPAGKGKPSTEVPVLPNSVGLQSAKKSLPAEASSSRKSSSSHATVECAQVQVSTPKRKSSEVVINLPHFREITKTPLVPLVSKDSLEKPVAFPVSTKSSKHRSSRGSLLSSAKATKSKDVHAKVKEKTAAKRKSSKSKKEAEAKKIASAGREEEAAIRKEALLKQQTEERKRKRELREARHQKMREQMELEQKSKQLKISLAAQKELERPKNGMKGTKRKQEENSDTENTSPEDNKQTTATTNALNETIVISKPTVPHNAPAHLENHENPKNAASKKLNETYNAEKENSNSYAMTPSTHEASYNNYDMSELRPSDESDEEDDTPKKPVPLWAQGMLLKEALIKQYYNPPNLSSLFTEIYVDPDETFGMMRKRKIQRTSSAVWLTPIRLL